MTDTLRRFLFDDLDIRGAVVRIDGVWRALLAGRNYPGPVARLLGEMCATALLLADNLKQPSRLSIQSRGDGPVSLLVVDCSAARNIRCMAHFGKITATSNPVELLGRGQLAISLDQSTLREPYQSIVPLTGKTVAEVFEHYLKQSEQLVSRFFLTATPTGVAGLFIQKMPGADERDPDGWTRIDALAATVQPAELLGLPSEELLGRIFLDETIRVFDEKPVTHDFPKDWDKVRNMLRTLGREDVYATLQKSGVIVIRDDLANHEYRFDKASVDEIFSNIPPTSLARH
ncbi:MAG: Hsp33 family molecular chaperone HslO [Candidatus Accumulibacter sp.]|jgi:molecular chaperone Hsp33|nr:Hsp33 family molecular chaperone HslO [Accumulibacter sp.]